MYLGVSTDIGRLDAFDAAAGLSGGAHPAIYDQWTTPDGDMQPILHEREDAQRNGGDDLVEPADDRRPGDRRKQGLVSQGPGVAVKNYGGPVFIRLDWEMNADWYPDWNMPGVTAAQFIASWRHVYEIFQTAGATQRGVRVVPDAVERTRRPESRPPGTPATRTWTGSASTRTRRAP